MIITLIVALFAFVAGARWFIQQGFAFGPTPTATATRRSATETPTLDFRATQNAEELATQRAQQMAMIGVDTPTPQATDTPFPTATATPTLASVAAPTPTPEITVVIVLPNVNGESGTPTQTASPDVNDETPTTDASDGVEAGSPTPADQPPVDALTATETSTATPTEIAAETPFSTPTPAPVAQPTVSLQAFTRQNAGVYAGPSSRYTRTTEIPSGQRVVMQGRNVTGEWVYLCCELNIEGWTRRINLDIRDNQLPGNAPTGASPNNERWLLERQSAAIPLTPIPSQTPIPESDFPLLRHDRAAQAAVEQTFLAPWVPDWTTTEAYQAFSSPVLVVGQSVLVANEDLHLYSFDRERGNQRWRYSIGEVVNVAPAAQIADGNLDVYVIDRSGRVFGLREQGNSANLLWMKSLNIIPQTGLNIAGDIVFATGQNSHVFALNRFTGDTIWEISTEGVSLQYPVVGDQLLYTGNQKLRAVDIFNRGTLIWESPPELLSGVSAPPVYGFPGVIALSEVYAADVGGRVHALDAVTGRLLWTYTGSDRIDVMALDRIRLYVVGNGFVKAINRANGAEAWSYNLGTQIVGGPLVGNGQILFVSTGGYIQILDSVGGALISGASSAARSVVNQPAVGGGRIFIPDANGILHAMREDR